eukprot:CAMPEP_0194316962 /NCGR_PEP_ID=MMETSP0171-20130528/13704_1 /TAXON_ID=218684 /ORGANISM="Corethron pennatum, Strain L29A3" /LENGTH=356 /DNA_ID=CAMNT_0039073385 /DNA_START=31 /DNA_END=1101 /DNA_ORIENTATION=-
METQPIIPAAEHRGGLHEVAGVPPNSPAAARRGQTASDGRKSGFPPHRGVPQIPPDLIHTVLPPDPLRMIFRSLPASHLFLAPVCRRFRDLYRDSIEEKKKHQTYKYAITSEAALQAYLKKKKEEHLQGGGRTTRLIRIEKRETSWIGAGCGRMDWVERGGKLNYITCWNAAKCGQLHVLQWLRERGPCNVETCGLAARHGHLEVLQWARGEGCPWDTATSFMAAASGHLEVLQWAVEHGCPWDWSTCSGAAEGGHLEVLQWARGEGCEWNSLTCMWAANEGHLEILRWARENGCPWDSDTCWAAADKGHFKIVQWAIENGCEYRENDVRNISDPKFSAWFDKHRDIPYGLFEIGF